MFNSGSGKIGGGEEFSFQVVDTDEIVLILNKTSLTQRWLPAFNNCLNQHMFTKLKLVPSLICPCGEVYPTCSKGMQAVRGRKERSMASAHGATPLCRKICMEVGRNLRTTHFISTLVLKCDVQRSERKEEDCQHSDQAQPENLWNQDGVQGPPIMGSDELFSSQSSTCMCYAQKKDLFLSFGKWNLHSDHTEQPTTARFSLFEL